MTCDECRERLQELVDNELASRERSAVESHLASCTTCTREYKELAHFTTSLAKAVRPIGPSAELSNRVLTVYHESREQLKAAPVQVLPPRQVLPRWAWIGAIGLMVLIALTVLLWPVGSESLGEVRDAPARVLRHSGSGWQETGRTSIRSGDRVETQKPESEAVVSLSAFGEAHLTAPCAVQVDRLDEMVTLQLLQQAPGRIVLQTKAAPAAGGRRLRVAWGSAWVDVSAGEVNDVTVEPLSGEGGGWTGQLKASVKTGAARLGNTGAAQTVGEGFSRVVPQSGECEPAVKRSQE